MDMRMIEHRAGPGVQHSQASEPTTKVTGIPCELLQGGRGAPHQQTVDFLLLCERQRA
jgi:hypothetical protein